MAGAQYPLSTICSSRHLRVVATFLFRVCSLGVTQNSGGHTIRLAWRSGWTLVAISYCRDQREPAFGQTRRAPLGPAIVHVDQPWCPLTVLAIHQLAVHWTGIAGLLFKIRGVLRLLRR